MLDAADGAAHDEVLAEALDDDDVVGDEAVSAFDEFEAALGLADAAGAGDEERRGRRCP